MSLDNHDGYRPIADYALIGNMRSAALIASDGSLDWCCFPRFDSPAVFCKLLDARQGGQFRIGPAGQHTCTRTYIDATNVLTMDFTVASGSFRLTDFIPVTRHARHDAARAEHNQSAVLRRVEGIAGECDVEVVFKPTFDFARAPSLVEIVDDGAHACGGDVAMRLRSPVPLQQHELGSAVARFRLRAGETRDFLLYFYTGVIPVSSDLPNFGTLLNETLAFWHEWSSRCTYHGPYHALVQRSTLVLKLLTYSPTGAVIAAPTTSLPEEIGGERNWDYRYTWIRDSALILQALMATGHHEESYAFFSWLESLCIEGCGGMQIMYTVTAERKLREETLSHLDGYRSSRPVRIGNGTAQQKQLDIYGELLDAVYFCYENMRLPHPEFWTLLSTIAEQAAQHWHEPDAGIWEMRGGEQHFVYSKLQCWVALDRAVRLAEQQHLTADLVRWRSIRDEIRAAILDQGYDRQQETFVQVFGGTALDASALMIPLVGFLPADDPRVRSTVANIQKSLTSNGLVYRYLNEDGLPGGEAAFALCSFWLIDNLVMAGQLDEARHLFEKVVSYRNDLGLFSEEFNPVTGELLGNYPQGFTHLACIRSAVALAEAQAAVDNRHAL